MCTNGINTGQFEQMIEQIDDHIKLERRWAHNLAHQAEDAGFETAGEKLHAAMSALDDIRALAAVSEGAIEGAITGRALYEGNFTLVQALAAARGEE